MALPRDPDAARAGTVRFGDLDVNRIGFGAMRLCGDDAWGRPRDRGNERRVLHRALDLGVNFIDTADSYGPEANETQIAEALYPYPKGLVIATKGGLMRPNRSSWVENGRPDHLRRALESSLKRLRVERIDLYQLHAPDSKVPFTESVGVLAEMQRAGRIRHLGLSNVTVKQLNAARRIAPIVSVQNQYNVNYRSSDDVVTECERLGIAFLPWYPLGGQRGMRTAGLKRIAARHGVAQTQVALAWLLARSRVMLAIPGTHNIEHLEENIGAVEIALTAADLAELGR